MWAESGKHKDLVYYHETSVECKYNILYKGDKKLVWKKKPQQKTNKWNKHKHFYYYFGCIIVICDNAVICLDYY